MHPCGFASAGSLYYKMWAGLNGFDTRNNLVLNGVRIGMGCMNLVTTISRSTHVPITLGLKYLAIPMAGMVSMTTLLLPLQLVTTMLTVCITL